MGGSKGQSSQTTNQTQTYTPNQQAYGYITDALGRAQQTANLPFNTPQAPVAGFSQDQQNAFQGVRNAQGMAQPYIDQAQNYFSPQGAQAFYNPMADSVTAQLKNIFGQQQQAATGQLTQAAGGVGADRIAVGQANLANQQGLAAGQTYANLYGQAVQQAQSAGYGTAALGSQAQNAALQGAQAQLGTGGLQQQLQQAQLNAPYQQQVAQSQFPYQQAQWYSNIVGGLAPGLGGTTTGTGQTTSQAAQPSVWSQILGAGLTGAGALGQSGAFGSNGWLTGSNSYGGLSAGNAFNNSNMNSNYYGPLNARGGRIAYAEGGEVSDQPIDITAHPFIDAGQMHAIQPHIPQLNLNPPQQQGGGGGGGGGLGDIIGTAAKILPMFLARGGSVDMKTFDGHDPFTFFQSRFPKGYAEGGAPDVIYMDEGPQEVDPKAMAAWRRGVDTDRAAGLSATLQTPEEASAPSTVQPLPPMITRGSRADAEPTARSAFAPETSSNPYVPRTAPQTTATEQPSAAVLTPAPGGSHKRDSFIDSPWAALTAAGLGIMGGTSPFAGVNIGQGGQKGLAMLQQQRENVHKDETTEQAARRLDQEAKFHEDQYSRVSMGQKLQQEQAKLPYEQRTLSQQDIAAHNKALEQRAQEDLDLRKSAQGLEAAKPFKIGTDANGFDIMGVRDPKNPGGFINATTGQPIKPADITAPSPEAQQANGQPQPGEGIVTANNRLVEGSSKQPYNYSQDAPYIEKGMDVPEPASVAGKSVGSVKTDSEYYLQTGKLPPVSRGKSPVAIAQQHYRDSVQNYGNALAASRGLTPEQVAGMWRTAPGQLRFILGQDGRSTVALGTAVRHLDTLKQYAEAWGGKDSQTYNRMRAAISREFGAAAATNLEAAGRIVGPEIIKAIGVAGAGGITERADVQAAFSPGASKEQLLQGITVVQKLLGGQLEGRERQARVAGVSEDRFKSMIGERPYEILRNVDKAAGQGATQGQPAAPKAEPAVRFQQLTTGGMTKEQAYAKMREEGY